MSANLKSLNPSPRTWNARMISPLCDKGVETPASFVAKTFSVDKAAGPVELFVSAQGLYIAFINGKRVGDDLLTPGWTNYDDRIAYQTYEVGSMLKNGENRLEIWLADGWFRSQIMFGPRKILNCYGTRIGAIAELVGQGGIIVATDASWKSGLLPIRKSGIYFGEIYDARVPLHVETDAVEELDFNLKLLVPHETSPVKEIDPIKPVEQWKDAEGRTLYDFGQNVGGYVRYTVKGEAGAEIRVEHSEVLGPDKEFDNRNYRTAVAHTIYTLGEPGETTYTPHFTFQGYRYARVTITGKAEITSIVSVPITSVPEAKGLFECGNKLVNRLVQNTMWSQRANFIEIPTDCPQRDERLGWTGDAQVFASTACYLADSHRFLRKYLRDVMVDQRSDGAIPHVSPDPWRITGKSGMGAGSTGWGDVIYVIPWVLYTHYGDREVLEECLDAGVRYADFLWGISDGPIIHPSPNRDDRGFTFGDWLQPVGDNRKPRPTISDDCVATLSHYICTDLLATIAGTLGKTDLQKQMRERAAAIKKAFAHEYIAPSGRLAHNDQTSYALGFLYDIIPDEHKEAAKGYFRRIIEDANYKIGTGFIGTPALLPALTKLGMHDLAEKVFLQMEVPGWLYQVGMGATTIWERWDSMAPDGTIYEPTMNSYNHYAYGAVCQWLFESVAGISPDPEAPGFERVVVSPAPLPGLNPVSAGHDCIKGRIEVKWTMKDGSVEYSLTLPEGCSGVFRPSHRLANATLDGKPAAAGTAIPSGKHVMTFGLQS